MREAQQQLVVMADKLEKKRWKKDELKATFVREHEERFRVQYKQQQLELQSRVQVPALSHVTRGACCCQWLSHQGSVTTVPCMWVRNDTMAHRADRHPRQP